MIVLNRYTQSGDYPELAKKLGESCVRFGLRTIIQAADVDEGDWLANVKQKPSWILTALLSHREAVLWLDADCEVVRLPSLLLGCSADFACYNWCADPENSNATPYDPNKLACSGGTLLFGYTAPAIELLCRWIYEVENEPSLKGTDPVLDRVYNTTRPPVHPLWLPKSYNRHDAYWPNVQPVINHAYRERGHAAGSGMHMFHFADVYNEAVEHAEDGDTFVEIGCWLGDSSSHMAKRIRDSRKAIRFVCVDTWKGNEGVEWMKAIVAQHGGDMLPAWKERMRTDGVLDFAQALQMPSLVAAAGTEDEGCAFVFLDGDHAYEAVCADIRAWLPKVKPGGLLAGDDYDRTSHPDVPRAVDELLPGAEIRGRSWLFRKAAA